MSLYAIEVLAFDGQPHDERVWARWCDSHGWTLGSTLRYTEDAEPTETLEDAIKHLRRPCRVVRFEETP